VAANAAVAGLKLSTSLPKESSFGCSDH